MARHHAPRPSRSPRAPTGCSRPSLDALSLRNQAPCELSVISAVILDLDGTILDGHLRHYACYQQICDKYDWPRMSLVDYWQAKRERTDPWHRTSVSEASLNSETLRKEWLDRIERPAVLALDSLHPGALEKLEEWHDQGLRLALATSRRFPDRLRHQLVRLRLDSFWHCVVTSDPGRGGAGKAQHVREKIPDVSPEHCLWIGDTEADIEAARAFGCRIWSVSCGLRTSSYLTSLSPDFLSGSLSEVDLRVAGGIHWSSLTF